MKPKFSVSLVTREKIDEYESDIVNDIWRTSGHILNQMYKQTVGLRKDVTDPVL